MTGSRMSSSGIFKNLGFGKFSLPGWIVAFIFFAHAGAAQVRCGADRTEAYLPLLKNKDIAVIANRASIIGKENLVDSLVRCGIHVVRIFCPEHGFRKYEEAGKSISGSTDAVTGIQIVSLYGKKKKPASEDLGDVDLLLFDLQDVGVRCFTYLSTLSYAMEACAENRIPMMVLDRPNPNGFYIDGPVLDSGYISFVGLHPVPLVYGMTIGEYAQMVNEEGWLKSGMICELQVIRMENYTHHTDYVLPEPPSPNLRNRNAILLYPSLCLFEGTSVSVGRGTDFPFEIFGSPAMKGFSFSFTPMENKAAGNTPLYSGQVCFGSDLRNFYDKNPGMKGKINLAWLVKSFADNGKNPGFFNPFFDKLAGDPLLKQQILNGASEEDIRRSWAEKTEGFREIRKKYLLYPD
jgi:uncharacterized protein YbbC (DUF1343 family)